MKSDLLVTIVTVSFNSERTIRRTVESVLQQSYTPIEYIIIDGQSTDSTKSLIEEMAPQFGGRLRLVSEPDRSAYDAMNKGISLAKGEIIGILNSDDWYLPKAVETVVSQFLNDESVDVVYGNVMRSFWINGKSFTIIGRAGSAANLGRDMTILHPASFVRRRCYSQWGAFDIQYRICADYELMLRFKKKGAHFIYVDDQFTFYSVGGLSSDVSLSLREFRRIQRLNGSRVSAEIIYIWKSIISLLIHGNFLKRTLTLLRTRLWKLRGVLIASESKEMRE